MENPLTLMKILMKLSTTGYGMMTTTLKKFSMELEGGTTEGQYQTLDQDVSHGIATCFPGTKVGPLPSERQNPTFV